MTKAKFDHTGLRPISQWTRVSLVEAAPLSALVRRRAYGLGRHLVFRESDGEDWLWRFCLPSNYISAMHYIVADTN